MNQRLLESFVKFINPNLKNRYHETLVHYSRYYVDLHPKLKKEFILRLHVLLKLLKFTSETRFIVSKEMKTIIASAIVQITFGLKNYAPKMYNTIDIAGSAFKFDNASSPLIGDVDGYSKIISLSWPDVEKGFLIPDDAINLAINQFTYSLCCEDNENAIFNRFFNDKKFKKWEKEAVKKMAELKEKTSKLPYPYKGNNTLHLFALCVEIFFEQPNKFQSMLPELYKSLSELLNQNPLKFANPITRLNKG